MKVLVHSNKNKDKEFIQTKEIINYLKSKQIEVVVSEEMFEDFNDSNITIFNPEETDQIKFVLVLGGDGSFLRAARQYYKYHLPFLGLNLGRVGYLTECDMNNAYEMIDMVLNKQYKIKDPSFNNWYGLGLAVRNNGISDFPLCNKSFNLSYCGNDL